MKFFEHFGADMLKQNHSASTTNGSGYQVST